MAPIVWGDGSYLDKAESFVRLVREERLQRQRDARVSGPCGVDMMCAGSGDVAPSTIASGMEFADLPAETKQRTLVNKELIKLVPENFKIAMLPAFFNHVDAERIGTVVRDTS